MPADRQPEAGRVGGTTGTRPDSFPLGPVT